MFAARTAKDFAVRRIRQKFTTLVVGGKAARQPNRVFLGAMAGAGAIAVATVTRNDGFLCADEGPGDAKAARTDASEIVRAEKRSSAFVFIKPHAVTDKVKELVGERFAKEGITVVSEGQIAAEKIDRDSLIDNHYGAIAARAMQQKPSELNVKASSEEEFEKTFGLSWKDALQKGLVFNLVDGAEKLGCTMSELGSKYDKLKKGVDMLKFGGGFYCGKVDDVFVINGFYAKMRSQFTVPGECIYFYEVEWDADKLNWGDFRGNVLGGTDPKTADGGSLRNAIYRGWSSLDLKAEPDTGNNGLHASASPFEAMAERVNWLGRSIDTDYFGRAMLAKGVSMESISAWCSDPAVSFDGKRQSLFDLLEDLDGAPCLEKSASIAREN